MTHPSAEHHQNPDVYLQGGGYRIIITICCCRVRIRLIHNGTVYTLMVERLYVPLNQTRFAFKHFAHAI